MYWWGNNAALFVCNFISYYQIVTNKMEKITTPNMIKTSSIHPSIVHISYHFFFIHNNSEIKILSVSIPLLKQETPSCFSVWCWLLIRLRSCNAMHVFCWLSGVFIIILEIINPHPIPMIKIDIPERFLSNIALRTK